MIQQFVDPPLAAAVVSCMTLAVSHLVMEEFWFILLFNFASDHWGLRAPYCCSTFPQSFWKGGNSDPPFLNTSQGRGKRVKMGRLLVYVRYMPPFWSWMQFQRVSTNILVMFYASNNINRLHNKTNRLFAWIVCTYFSSLVWRKRCRDVELWT